MSELKATKGPWSVYETDLDNANYGIDADGGNSIIVFGVDGEAGGVDQWPNACLIAAAPELYAELEELKSALRVTIDEYKSVMRPAWVQGMENDIASAEKLLAKARGEA